MATAFLFIMQKYFITKEHNVELPLKRNLTFNEKMAISSKICHNDSLPYDESIAIYNYYQFIMFALYDEVKFVNCKFKLLRDGLENIFYNTKIKDAHINIFYKLQKVYRCMCRLAFIYKFKRAKLQVATDLLLNDLSPTDKNVLTIFDSNSKYLFSLSDLVNVFYTSLCNSAYFIPAPVSCKNPYTNIPFSKANLYNIYFFILRNKVKVPVIIQNYFLCNFSLFRFEFENKRLIHKISLERYVNNSPPTYLYSSITDMLYEHNRNKPRLKIHTDFPVNKLVEIMRPYLILYYKSKYSGCRLLNRKNHVLLCKKMKEFIKFNPKFGQKMKALSNMTIGWISQPLQSLFNERHIIYSLRNEDESNFGKSHLSVDAYNTDDTYDDDDADDDDNDNDEEDLGMYY
jgi:hypothetical protein